MELLKMKAETLGQTMAKVLEETMNDAVNDPLVTFDFVGGNDRLDDILFMESQKGSSYCLILQEFCMINSEGVKTDYSLAKDFSKVFGKSGLKSGTIKCEFHQNEPHRLFKLKFLYEDQAFDLYPDHFSGRYPHQRP